MIVDGFGIHAKLVGVVHPDPQTGQLTVVFDDLPQVPFEDFDLHLFASDRGLMATPTHCTHLHVDSRLHPLERSARRQTLAPALQPRLAARTGRPARPRSGPFQPRLVAGTSNPVAGAFSELPPEARPRRRRPVPRRPQLQDAARLHRRPARDQLLPGGGDRRAAASSRAAPSRRARAVRPRARSGPRTSPPGPGATRSTRSGRCTWRARSRAPR